MTDPREDVGAFSAQVLGRPLWPHQLEVARSQAFITTLAKARRTGGSELAEDMAIWTAFRERDVKVLIMSATEDASRRLTENVGTKLDRSDLARGAVKDGWASRIRLTNGSEIVSLPASQRQVRGYGKGVRLVILDEAGFMPSELWTAAHYTALDERPRSRILMLGTPWGGAEHFFRRAFAAGEDGDPDHASYHWTYEVNPRLDRAYLERQRQRVSPAEYAAEVLGEWSEAQGALFPRELLDAATADLELPASPAALPERARPIVGLDWGVSFDRSAAAVIYRLPVAALNPEREARPVFVCVPHVWPVKTPLGSVVDDVVASPAPWAALSTETSGVGAMPSQELYRRIAGRDGRRAWNMVATTAAKKTAGYGVILALLERGQLVLPRNPELLRQLAGLRFEQGERGFTRIEADNPAVHDDVADALYLAALPYTARNGRVLCKLSTLADPTRAAADADLPGDYHGERVQTGAGLTLWRNPPLQSAAGREVALRGWSRPRPAPLRVGDFLIDPTPQEAHA